MPIPIHVAAMQYATETHNRSSNHHNVVHLIDDAAHVSDLVVLPMASFYRYWPGEPIDKLAEPVPGPTTAIVSQIATTRNTHICFTLIERELDKLYSTAVLVGADGRVVGRHRKLRLSEQEIEAGFSSGDRLDVFDTHIGKIGLIIDTEAHEGKIMRLLHLNDAEIVLIPCAASAVPPESIESVSRAWETVLQAGAKHGQCHVVWANKIGEERGFPLVGNSMILDSDGNTVSRGSSSEVEFVRARVTLQAKGYRRERLAG